MPPVPPDVPYDPIKVDRIIYVGTDHFWQLRRVQSDGEVFIPESAKAQLRNSDRSVLWLTPEIEIDPVDGWISITIPREVTETPIWRQRKHGTWDLECVLDGKKHRWAYGSVCVSTETTLI